MFHGSPGWRGDGVSRGSASRRRHHHPGRVVWTKRIRREGTFFELISTLYFLAISTKHRRCGDWGLRRCGHVKFAAEYGVHCRKDAKARA
eukprot:2196852-Amphidinium_carterae.1